MDERTFLRLEFQVEALQERVARLESEAKELYGSIKALDGQLAGDKRYTTLSEQLEQYRQENTNQEREIGILIEGVRAIKEALSKARDKSLSDAAQSITINVEGGRGGQTSNFNNNIDGNGANVGQGGSVQQK
jgi:chromosome segregation ATPase